MQALFRKKSPSFFMEFGVMSSSWIIISSNGLSSFSSDHGLKRKWCGSTDLLQKQQMSEISHENEDFKPTNWSKLSNDSSFVFSDTQQEENMLSFSSLPKLDSFSSKYNGGLLVNKNLLQNPTTFPYFQHSNSSYTKNAVEWGPFHLGFASSTDLKVGRCRRTDGKKWQSSRDAVPDQKYCERHINRGRHRSRKPVEGLTGHSVSGATTNRSSNNNTTTSVMNNGSSSSALAVLRGAPSNSATINLDQSKDIQLQLFPSLAQRLMVNKANSSQRMQSTQGLDILSPKNCLKSTNSVAGDFQFHTSDAILSTSHTSSPASRTYAQSHDLTVEYSSQLVMEDPSIILWPKLQTQTNRTTKLSISIPPANFMPCTSSPTVEKVALSPLRLSQELDHVPVDVEVDMGMCMGMGFDFDTVSND